MLANRVRCPNLNILIADDRTHSDLCSEKQISLCRNGEEDGEGIRDWTDCTDSKIWLISLENLFKNTS